MEVIKLNKDWTLKILGKDAALTKDGIQAPVPGTVYGALLKEGLIEDPYYRDNELKVLPLMDNDFEYTTTFTVTPEMTEADALLLKFDGIDTLADIYVNGLLLGQTKNMHRSYEFDLLHSDCGAPVNVGENTLCVHIYSPTTYIAIENQKCYTGGSGECMEGFPHLRKAHCMFGWDWGPRVPDAGIYREVSLEVINHARINSVLIKQEHIWDAKDISFAGTKNIPPSRVDLTFDIDIELFNEDNDTNVTIVVYSPSGEIYTQAEDTYVVSITEPELWWPNGYGAQPLYNVEIVLSDYRKHKLDSVTKRIGLRTMEMNTEADEFGNCFAHQINGVKIFAMGADYIPEDNLFGRITKERTRRLLEDAVWANHNCIRVWGGGYYPDDFFYDICDELGLIVWQDFMFACASYELDDEFEENIIGEAIDVVRRIRHHASLGLWCGNNEMETQTLDKAWKPTLKQKADYTKIFEYILPKICKAEDPQRFYWPSSPSSGGNFDNPWDEHKGDAHYWDVWHGEKPFTEYRKFKFRYLSEFGFQSFPSVRTIESFTLPEDRNVFSRVMEMHQRNCSANGKILSYISATYLYPKNFDMLVYTSQLLQGDAIRYGVEHFRRNRGECMGTVVWQLNDIWPVASWSSIDYYGRWKALHYMERRMFAPLMISCEETGELTERPFCVQQPKEIKKGARLHVANETRIPFGGSVKWRLLTSDSQELLSGTQGVKVDALSGLWLDYMDFSEYDEREVHLSYELISLGKCVSQGTALFTPPKHYYFKNPNLSIRRDGDKLIITADAYAKNVCITGVDSEVYLSDNYFDMDKGEKSVSIIRGDAKEFCIKSVYDIG